MLNGVLLKPGVNSTNYDSIYPKAKKTEHVDRLQTDACLGTTKPTMTG